MEELLFTFVKQCWAERGSSSAAPPAPCLHIRETPDQGRTLVLADAVVPDQIVLSVPANALLNLKTVRDVFPAWVLPRPAPLWTPLPEPPTPPSDDADPAWGTALHAEPGTAGSGATPGPMRHSSLLSLYLAICRQFPRDQLPPRLARITPMIDSMPDSLFSSHPLWLYLYAHRRFQPPPGSSKDFWKTAWTSLSPHVRSLIQDTYRRFRRDWATACKTYQHIPTTNAIRDKLFPSTPTPDRWHISLPVITIEVFVWAWLCVNTRCLSYDLHLAPSQENMTLMPVIDMANHSDDGPACFRVAFSSRGGLDLRAPPADHVHKDPDGHWRGLRQGDPVCLEYGPHSNSFLFAEYGFILTKDTGAGWNRYNDLVLDDQVDEYIAQHLDTWSLQRTGDPLHPRTVLNEAGYGGDWTVQEQPLPAHPSWRTTMAMWCLSCYASDRASTERALRKWHKAVSGLVPSAGSPAAAARILADVLAAAKPSKTRADALDKMRASTSGQPGSLSQHHALISVSAGLFAEEQAMADSLLGRIQSLLSSPDPDWSAFWNA